MNTVLANMQPIFKHFSDYVNVIPTKFSTPACFRAHYWAKQKINDRPTDPAYKNNTWKLVMRRGIYLAEVEKAMSEIYSYYLGYSTDIDLVEEQGNYYVARRDFKHFKPFASKLIGDNSLLIQKKQKQFFIEDYALMEDGTLIAGNKTKQLKGIASLAVLTQFFGESDSHMINYGLQETKTEFRCLQIDNEGALRFHNDPLGAFMLPDDPDNPIEWREIEKDLQDTLGEDFIQMSWYQKEKRAMQEKIANTDFAIIERIIQKNITVSQLEEIRWTLTKILSDPTVMPGYDRQQAQKQLAEYDKMDASEYSVDSIILELKSRQERLRRQLASK